MKVIELNITEYKGYELEYQYQTKFYYDVKIKKRKGIQIIIKKKKFFKRQDKRFVSHLFEDYIEGAQVFAIYQKKKMVAVIEGSHETWNNRYRIWNLLVDKKYRGQGYGQALFKYIENQAKQIGARALILEVQSCNVSAIDFYIEQGMHFVGLNTMEYTNRDIENKEVRLEMGKRIIHS